MTLHPDLPRSPYAPLLPAHRWFPADEALRASAYEQLPPNYTPNFIVKADDGSVTIVETKGREELDLPRNMARLAQWCEDATAASQAQGGPAYRFAYVDQDGFDRHPPASLPELVTMFREYQPPAAA